MLYIYSTILRYKFIVSTHAFFKTSKCKDGHIPIRTLMTVHVRAQAIDMR